MDTYEKLHDYIDNYCYSRSRIARKLNKHPSWLTNILAGKTNLKYEDFKKICSAIGTSIDEIESYEESEDDRTESCM